jgi:hypothetical protein
LVENNRMRMRRRFLDRMNRIDKIQRINMKRGHLVRP